MNRCKVCKEEPQDCTCSREGGRLLGEENIKPLRESIFGPGIDINNQIKIFMDLCLLAQLIKADEDWIRWGGSTCPHGVGDFYEGDKVVTQCFKIACGLCWEDRKKEIKR